MAPTRVSTRGSAVRAGESMQPGPVSCNLLMWPPKRSLYPFASVLSLSGKPREGRDPGPEAVMQCNVLPHSWLTPDRNRSPLADNVQCHSCSGRLNRAQALAVACPRRHAESVGSEEVAARQHSACHAGPSGRVSTC